MFRALQQILIRSQAEGLQLGSYTGCKAMPAVVQAKEKLKLIQRKKKSNLLYTLEVKGWERDVLLSPLLPNLGRGMSTFSRFLMVLAKSDSAATHTSSTLSVGGIILCLLRASASFPLLIMDAWDLNTGKIMVLWRRSRQ